MDLALLHGAAEKGETQVAWSLTCGGGGLCTGIQKLIQRFVMLLLTPKGSMKFMPDRGCTFPSAVGQSYSESQVSAAFRFAMADVAPQLKAEEDESMPDDERFRSAELLDITFFGTTLSIAVSLTSRAGSSHEVILPIYEL